MSEPRCPWLPALHLREIFHARRAATSSRVFTESPRGFLTKRSGSVPYPKVESFCELRRGVPGLEGKQWTRHGNDTGLQATQATPLRASARTHAFSSFSHRDQCAVGWRFTELELAGTERHRRAGRREAEHAGACEVKRPRGFVTKRSGNLPYPKTLVFSLHVVQGQPHSAPYLDTRVLELPYINSFELLTEA